MRFSFFVALLLVALPGCGLTLDPGEDGGFDAATADAGGGVGCGATTCAPGLECCSESCGICAPPGEGCPTVECIDAGPGDDAGTRRDAGPSDAGATGCGSTTCAAREECCTDCDGNHFCSAGGCPEMPCPATCTSRASCAATEYCDQPMGCATTGTCAARPVTCPDSCPGVCGCDMITYCNECDAHAMGQTVATNTPCAFPRGCLGFDAHSTGVCAGIVGWAWDGFRCVNIDCSCTGTECGLLYPSLESCQSALAYCSCGGFLGTPCPSGAFCDYPPDAMCGAGDAGGICHPVPLSCPDVRMPVCGCDGVTYGNACEANMARVAVSATGTCVGGAP